MKKKLLFIHPYLFAIYPVIFLYALNIHEYTEEVILGPLILVIFFAAIVLGITNFLIKDITKAAVISSSIIFLSLSYSRFLEFATGILPSYAIAGTLPIAVISVSITLLIGVIYGVFRFTKFLLQVNKLLTYLGVFLVLFSCLQIILFEFQTGRIFSKTSQTSETIKTGTHAKNTPDIYYFIFDRYAGPGSLKQQYDFDNSTFFNFLKKKGFYLAENAKTNYPKTFLSLGSTFNMEYLDYLTDKTHGGASSDESIVTPLIRNGKIIKFLKAKGYTIVNIGPKTWTPTSINPGADKNFIMPNSTYPYADIFTTGFLNTTLAAPILHAIIRNPNDVSVDPNNNEHRNITLYEEGAVEQAIAIKGPKFVFVHILLPHDPFVFDKNCQPIDEATVKEHDHVYNYLQQLQCANKKISTFVNDILTKSKTPPVIILQSDEGPFPMKSMVDENQAWAKADDTALREKFPILNAYYFPNASTSALYDSITPVNSFRVLFNTYFGTNYELLPDKNYVFEDEKNYYKFTDVTERVK